MTIPFILSSPWARCGLGVSPALARRFRIFGIDGSGNAEVEFVAADPYFLFRMFGMTGIGQRE